MRLNVFLQKAGVGSRREAERLVEDGRVTINGRVAAATDPVTDADRVTVDGNPVAPENAPLPRLFMLHKPLHHLVTTYDPQGRRTIYDLPALNPPQWDASKPRIMNVGRLDVNSEGLLLLSSDGPLAQAMMSPATALERVYRVRVHGRLTAAQIERLSHGVVANGIRYRGAQVTEEQAPPGKVRGANTWYEIVLTEGKNREIRKLMEHFGCVVNRLIRTAYGPFQLGKLPVGAVQEVPASHVGRLLDLLHGRGATL